MNKTVQIAASGIIGLSAGLLGGYILAGRHLEAKYQKLADDEISTMRRKFREQREDLEDKVKDKKREMQETQDYLGATADLVRRKYGVDDVYADLNDLREEDTTIVEYEDKVSTYRPEENVEEDKMYEPQDELSELGKVDEDQKEPYFIDEEVFSLNERNYTHSMLTYFIHDGILMDDTDQVVEDEAPIIGDALKVLDDKPHINQAYIRNNRIMLEVEIVIERDSFADFAYSVGINGS